MAFGNLNLKGTELTVRKMEVAETPKLRKLGETYSEHAKLVFIFDISGSMSSGVGKYVEGEKLPSRMELTKSVAKAQIEARFAKYPGSHVAVIQFGDGHDVLFDDGKPEELWPKLEEMDCHGRRSSSTDIMGAIRGAMTVCRKSPSPVGVHHFIMVGDGGDGGTRVIDSWIPALKASGVVLDYIHIGESHYANEDLQRACLALGGEFVAVDSAEAFQERFLTAMNRLLLPPGA